MLCACLLQLSFTSKPPLETLKQDFRLLAARNDRGFSASPSTIKKLQELASELESVTESYLAFAPTTMPELQGKWSLDFCDAADVLSIAFVPLPPGSRIGNIYQDVSTGPEPDTFVARNGVELTPPGVISAIADAPPLIYEVEARCKTLDATRVSLAFVGGRVKPPLLPAAGATLPNALIERVQTLFAERVYLETTYLDADLRISRGPGRELYVLSKRN